jgi:membrane-bound lytic murein transglycosylase D
MYRIFGDWDLVLASYNSGPGNVAKAIRRSGGQQNYWNIRKNLPKETQGYLPAFLATMYIFEYHKEHGIVPKKPIANHFATDTIMVKKHMTFKQISDLLDISVDELKFYNPSYKRNEVPFVTGDQNFLRLPKDKIAIFTSNEDKVYAYIAYEESKRERPYQAPIAQKINPGDIKYHKVRKGDNIADIAAKYEVTEDDIKKWNGLNSSYLKSGRNLKIKISESSLAVKDTLSKPVINQDVAVAPAAKKPKPESKKAINSVKEMPDSKWHTVVKNDGLYSIAKEHNLKPEDIRKWNNLPDDNVKIGMQLVLTAPDAPAVAVETTNKEHVVAKGEYLGTIAKKYKISIEDIRAWNHIEGNNVMAGTTLIVGKSKANTLPEVDLNKKDIAATTSKAKEKTYQVQPGDSLYKISKKFPGVSISDIKKLNNLKEDDLKPGMKLKING